jgi:Transposase domain (DUF772)
VGQPGFFDLDKRLETISAKGDPLEALNAIVPFESFRADIEAVIRPAAEERKSNAGRKPFDAVMVFKILLLHTLYNLADEQVEYQIRDRLSFMRFLGLGLEDTVPDATTVWLFREALAKAGLVKTLFERFNGHLDAKGYIARGGQIVDATIVNAPKQHNTRDENEAIKAGKTPEGWDEKPTKNAQIKKISTATRTTSALTASTRSFGATRRPTLLFTTARSLMRSWTSPTRATRCGPTAPTGRQKLKRSSRKRAARATSIAAAPATTLYLSGKRPPIPRAHECALASNTYLRIGKTGWAAYSCVPLGWRARP